jgi:hypothetical protein
LDCHRRDSDNERMNMPKSEKEAKAKAFFFFFEINIKMMKQLSKSMDIHSGQFFPSFRLI